MPICKHGKLCKIKNCPLKHIDDEEMEECIFYKQGFCCNGPKCGRRHIKRTPEECPAEVFFDSFSNISASANTAGGSQLSSNNMNNKKLKVGQPNDNFKVSLCTHWLLNNSCPFQNECHFAHGEDELNIESLTPIDFLYDADIYDPTRNIIGVPLELPFPTTNIRCNYYLLQSPDLRSLLISKNKNVWQVSKKIGLEMNESFRKNDQVILFFCVRALRGIYGVARMASMISFNNMMNPNFSSEFKIEWLRTCRISLQTISQLKLHNTGIFISRYSSDGKFENKVGLDMLLTAYRKPVWDWSREREAAESNIRLKDPTLVARNLTSASASLTNEYYPVNGFSAYYLPPDVLFAPDWIERCCSDRGNLLTNTRANTAAILPFTELYTGNLPAIIIPSITGVIAEMLSKNLIGFPANFFPGTSENDVHIPAETPILIFDTQAGILLGLFLTTANSQLNIDPKAFNFSNQPNPTSSSLPIQAPIKSLVEGSPIQIMFHDNELKQALGQHYGNFTTFLPLKETKELCSLLSRRYYTIVLARNSAKPGANQGAGFYTPPFKNVEVVPINIEGNIYEIKRKILGNNASTIMNIIEELGVPKQTIRIRIRGIGSGFLEGPSQQELQEPLQFNISAENEELLSRAVSKVKELIENVRNSMNNSMNT